MKLKYVSIFVILFIVCNLVGCQSNKDDLNKEYPVSINGVSLDQAPKKVVVLSDSLADIILACSMEIKLVGRTTECTQKELTVLPEVGSNSAPDMQKIKDLSPDIVLSSGELSSENLEKIKDSNIKVFVLPDATNRTELIDLYSNIGCILGGKITGKQKCEQVAQKLLVQVDDLSRVYGASGSVCVTACYLFDEKGAIATDDTFAGKLIENVGATNIAANAKNKYMDVKDIILSNPTVIFCEKGVEVKLRSDKKFWELSAIDQHKIFEMDKGFITRQGKTILEVIKFMAEKINTVK